MKISMLMATLNRRELMLNAVNSILGQSFQNFEIIIVDQSEISNADVAEIDPRINYIHITRKGLSLARNEGIKHITGDIVGLMDDDATYSDDVLNKVNYEFERNSNLGLVSGAVVDPSTKKISLRGMGETRQKITRKNIFRCSISPSMFIKKDVFLKNNFDEEFGLGAFWGSAEETDLALRILYENYEATFCPDIIVYHPSCDRKDVPLTKLESYSRGFGAICAKHIYLYGNKTMRYLYRRALFRALGGYILSALKASKHMCQYFRISYKAKREGYKSYKYKYKK